MIIKKHRVAAIRNAIAQKQCARERERGTGRREKERDREIVRARVRVSGDHPLQQRVARVV